jgi:hypothetical protein
VITLWRIYRLDAETDDYWVWALDREAAIRTARLEHFGLVRVRGQLGYELLTGGTL